ncbi:MAG: glyceraldehyde 3-phosphate dehydrogenase NAD-binding domain-containing protein, partial [Pseudohongiella sp.]|nr:glyceraldehyde 3-phosphate dehydrogenase NAD-binding domain-containing protein [Pseudohongiella sp.]
MNNDLLNAGNVPAGIIGFGRIGRLALRVIYGQPAAERRLRVIQINDPGGDAATLAHLLNFDSVHGRWHLEARAERWAVKLFLSHWWEVAYICHYG